jgi:putative toxin-antitoxin system antitoxin component (TIGR02293 family)
MKAEQGDSRTVFALMGNLLGCQVATEADVLALTCKGIAVGTYKRLAKTLQLKPAMVVSIATLRRRSKPPGRLTPEESDRLLRILRMHCKAVQFFGDPNLAQQWMRRPAPLLPGEQSVSPQALAIFDSGARLLEGLMDRTTHGIF